MVGSQRTKEGALVGRNCMLLQCREGRGNLAKGLTMIDDCLECRARRRPNDFLLYSRSWSEKMTLAGVATICALAALIMEPLLPLLPCVVVAGFFTVRGSLWPEPTIPIVVCSRGD